MLYPTELRGLGTFLARRGVCAPGRKSAASVLYVDAGSRDSSIGMVWHPLLALGVVSVALAPASVAAEPQPCAMRGGRTAAVAEALDGGALRLADGSEATLAGIVLPNRLDGEAGSPALAEAARARVAQLTVGASVRLVAAARRPDRYGRMAAQVFANGAWLQGELLKAGLARVSAVAEPAGCAKALAALEAEARRARRGLWADPGYAVRDAEDLGALNRLVGRFAVVEGRVLAAGQARGTTYLNFGRHWKEDFTVKIRGRARKGVEAALGDPLALKGRRIRVRGWIESENGPMIAVARAEQIELAE